NAAVNYDDAWHPLQQIAVDSSGSSASVDQNSNNVIDNSDSCSGDSVCEMNSGSVSGDMTANAYYYSSDINLKKDVAKIDSPIKRLNHINGVEFIWKDNNEKSIGLIAQNVEEEFPELVRTDKKSGMKSVQYGNMVGVLVEAVKKQQKQIDTLEKKIEELKNE
ncbi:MAG: tail fiber domain-containing protein, partial [Nanobdellota archaeon]